MLELRPLRSPRHILCLGAHCDDIEIGCGAALMRLAEEYPQAHFEWVVLSSNAVRAAEEGESFDYFMQPAHSKSLRMREFRNGYFPTVIADIKDYFEELKGGPIFDLILTHFREDLHQDHRIIADLTWNTFRDHLIVEYEIPKYDGGLGSPNLFIPVSQALAQRKVEGLMRYFASQRDKRWFTEDTFYGLMRLRGVECNANYAEAFYCRKAVFS
ncbi:MAG: PIG-L deacetylase family protein [Gammaproteobacteria bacterium]